MDIDIDRLVFRIAAEVGAAPTHAWTEHTERLDLQVYEALATHTDSGSVKEAMSIVEAAVRRGVEAYLAGPPDTSIEDELVLNIGADPG